MKNPRLAGRYAKSLMDIALEQNNVDAVCSDMRLVQSICKSSKEFSAVLNSPVISSDKKGAIIKEILSGKTTPLTDLFINLLLNKGREGNLKEIAEAFIQQFNQLKNIHHVKLTTAEPISNKLQNFLIEKLKTEKGLQNVEVESLIDPSIIGGYKMQLEDLLIDNSISRDLIDVKRQFLNNDYLRQIR